jgi:murein endopeptidase
MISIVKLSIFNVDRNFTNIESIKKTSFVTKTTSVERILFNQKLKKRLCHDLVSIFWSNDQDQK